MFLTVTVSDSYVVDFNFHQRKVYFVYVLFRTYITCKYRACTVSCALMHNDTTVR